MLYIVKGLKIGGLESNLKQSCLSTTQMLVCTLYLWKILSLISRSFSIEAGPRQGGRDMTDMKGALISRGMERGERDSL